MNSRVLFIDAYEIKKSMKRSRVEKSNRKIKHAERRWKIEKFHRFYMLRRKRNTLSQRFPIFFWYAKPLYLKKIATHLI